MQSTQSEEAWTLFLYCFLVLSTHNLETRGAEDRMCNLGNEKRCMSVFPLSHLCVCASMCIFILVITFLCVSWAFICFFLPSPDCYHLLLIVSSRVLPSPVSCSPVSVPCTYSPVCQSVRCGLRICLHFWVFVFLVSVYSPCLDFCFQLGKKKFIFCFWAFVALSLPLLPVIRSSIVGEICGAFVLIFHFQW